MAAPNLTRMSVDELLTLRERVSAQLETRRHQLEQEISRLQSDTPPSRSGRGSALLGRKVPPKYRGPQGETWSGRGATPRWLAALLKQGRKRDDFAITKIPTSTKRTAAKKRRKRKKK